MGAISGGNLTVGGESPAGIKAGWLNQKALSLSAYDKRRIGG